MNPYPTTESLIRSFNESSDKHNQNINNERDVMSVFPSISLLSVIVTTMDLASCHLEPSEVFEALVKPVPPLLANGDGIPIQRACL